MSDVPNLAVRRSVLAHLEDLVDEVEDPNMKVISFASADDVEPADLSLVDLIAHIRGDTAIGREVVNEWHALALMNEGGFVSVGDVGEPPKEEPNKSGGGLTS